MRSKPETSLGSRLAVLLLVVAAIAIVIRANGLETDRADPPLQPGPTAHSAEVTQLSVRTSAELDDAHADHLVDGDETTTWRAPWSDGDHLVVILTMGQPERITGVELVTGQTRPGTVGVFELHINDMPPILGEIDAATLRYWVGLPETMTSEVAIHITDVNIAEESPIEVELAEIRLYAAST